MSFLVSLVLVAAPAPAAEPLAMSVKSWGKTLSDWTMAGDGSIVWREAADRPGGDFRNYDEITRQTAPDPARRKWLANLLAKARKQAASPPPCGGRVPDGWYGEARWGNPAAATLKFDAGCQGAEAQAVLRILMQANAQVKVWARKAPEASRRAAIVE